MDIDEMCTDMIEMIREVAKTGCFKTPTFGETLISMLLEGGDFKSQTDETKLFRFVWVAYEIHHAAGAVASLKLLITVNAYCIQQTGKSIIKELVEAGFENNYLEKKNCPKCYYCMKSRKLMKQSLKELKNKI